MPPTRGVRLTRGAKLGRDPELRRGTSGNPVGCVNSCSSPSAAAAPPRYSYWRAPSSCRGRGAALGELQLFTQPTGLPLVPRLSSGSRPSFAPRVSLTPRVGGIPAACMFGVAGAF